jgi:hypothetical protein
MSNKLIKPKSYLGPTWLYPLLQLVQLQIPGLKINIEMMSAPHI